MAGPDPAEGTATGDGAWQERLRASGRRLTPQRELVLAAVETLRHATPDEVYGEVRRHSSAINLSTVYRTLEMLDEIGLIRHAHIEDRAPTYHSANDHEHFHLVCRECHEVISVDPHRLERFRTEMREAYSFHVDVGHLTVFGTCDRCSQELADESTGAGPPAGNGPTA